MIQDQNAWLSIVSTYNAGQEDEETLEFSASADYIADPGEDPYVYYFETELTGLKGCYTQLSFLPDAVILDRHGPVRSHMEFREGFEEPFLYELGGGELPLTARTTRLRHDMGERGGQAEIEYSLGLGSSVFTRNRIQISIQAEPEPEPEPEKPKRRKKKDD